MSEEIKSTIEELTHSNEPIINKDTLLTYEGKTMTISAWAKLTHISTICLIKRKMAGWNDEKILSEKPPAKSSKTICWECARAAGYMGGCNWSNYCIGKCENPEVEGWDAEKKFNEKLSHARTKMVDEIRFQDGGLTYVVHECPMFISDKDVVIPFSI